MKKTHYLAVLALLLASHANAEQTAAGLKLDTPKDALLSIGKDHFGSVSLEKLMADIKADNLYVNNEKFAQGRVSVESQNDPKHYGSVDFEFKKPFNFTQQELIAHLSTATGATPSTNNGMVSFRWKSNGFNCLVDFEDNESFQLFQYLCHFVEE